MSYRDTIREQLISAMTAALAGMRTAAGYNVDLGSTVKRGETLSDKDLLPAIAIFPLSETNERLPGRHNLTMTVRVEGLSKFGTKNPSVVAEAMLGDIVRLMTNPLSGGICGGLADKVEYTEGGVDGYPEPGQYTVGCYCVFNVQYKTRLGDPFIQSDSLSIQKTEAVSISDVVSM